MAEAFDIEARRDAWEDLRPVADGGSGLSVTLHGVATYTRNPSTGVVTQTPAADVTGCGMLEGYKAHLIDGTRIRTTDKRLWLCGLDVTGENAVAIPKAGDKITVPVGGLQFEVVTVEAYEPAGNHVWSYVQLRR